MSASGTAAFEPEIFPAVYLQLILFSSGNPELSAWANVPMISPDASLGKYSFFSSSSAQFKIAVVAK